MISIEHYSPKYDADLREWLTAHQMDTEVVRQLPYSGFVALLRGTPIAAGFLRLVEGGFGILDSFVTNPDAPGEYRAQALDLLITETINRAKSLELKQVFGMTGDNHTLLRAQRHGMTATSHRLLALPLTLKGEE